MRALDVDPPDSCAAVNCLFSHTIIFSLAWFFLDVSSAFAAAAAASFCTASARGRETTEYT